MEKVDLYEPCDNPDCECDPCECETCKCSAIDPFQLVEQ